MLKSHLLTHWGRVMHICISKLTIIGSNNGLSPGRRQAIIWTNVGISSIGPLGTNFSEILIGNIFIEGNAFEIVVWKMAAILSRPQCVKPLSAISMCIWDPKLVIIVFADVLQHQQIHMVNYHLYVIHISFIHSLLGHSIPGDICNMH